MTYPNGTSETFNNDTFGNRVSKTDRMGQTITYVYNHSGWLETRSYPDSSVDKFTYDAAGNLLSAEDETGKIGFEYDGAGRISQVTYPDGEVVSYGYDANSNRTQLTYPNGMVLNYTRDNLNRLIRISESVKMVADYTYDPLGRVSRRELQNGTYSLYSYDSSNRLLEIVNSKSTSELISRFTYTYDQVGNRLTMTTLEGLTQYAYDALHQLTNVTYPDGSTTSYQLDHTGNRISEIVDGNAIDYKANSLNQYTDINGDSYAYDANGNMTSKTTPSGTTTYTYDFDSRLVQIDTVTEIISYKYDPFGRRTSKTTSSGTTNYIHDGFRVILEKDDAGAVQASYIHGIGIDELLAMERNDAYFYYCQDGLGSVTNLTDSSENIVESFTYDAYGVPSNTSSVGNPYLYTGREYETATELFFYRGRYYNPRLGRFITMDPVKFFEGTNLYTYVKNNPIKYFDPLGLSRLVGGDPEIVRALEEEKLRLLREFEDELFWGKFFDLYDPRKGFWKAIYDYIEFVLTLNRRAQELKNKLQELDRIMEPFLPILEDGEPEIAVPCVGQGCAAGDPTFVQVPEKRARPASKPSFSKFDSNATNIPQRNLVAQIKAPSEASLVRANVPIFGQAYGKAFKEYRVEYGVGENPSEWIQIDKSIKPQTKEITTNDLNDSTDLTIHGNLATWDTGLKNYVYLPSHPKGHPIDLKGTYTIRLVVTGNDGSTTEDKVTVDVANVIPNAWGGQANSKDGRVVLTVPEQAIMDSFRLILIEAVPNEGFGSLLEGQVIGNIYKIREPGEQFTNDSLLQIVYEKEELGNALPDQLGIYGYNLKTKAWEYLDSTRDERNNFVFAKVRKLHAYYALMASKMTGEGSVEAPVLQERSHSQQAGTIPGYGHTLVRNTFEVGLGEWSNRDNEVGAILALDNKATFDGTNSLKITNTHVGGNFAVTARTTSFDAREYPLVQFDYRIPPSLKTNFLVKVNGRWYEIGFTDDPKELDAQRVNIAHIGDIAGVIADDAWHTATFNLYDMLRTKTRHSQVEEMIMADWDVVGYMKLQFGHNSQGATYYIDNFSISRAISPGLRMDSDTILVDDFNQRKVTNTFSAVTAVFNDGKSGSVESGFSAGNAYGNGHGLRLVYDVSEEGSYGGYLSPLPHLDLWDYDRLTFYVKSEEEAQDLFVGLKDINGRESKVLISPYFSQVPTSAWREVSIPLVAFSDIADWGRVDLLSFSFAHPLHNRGVVFVDQIAFKKGINHFLVDNFERNDDKNSVGRPYWTYVNGAAAINGKQVHNSPNGIYRLSFGGNIGKIKAYASEEKSFAGWTTSIGGVSCSRCETLAFEVRGAEGGENATVYLDDGNFRWGLELAKFVDVTTEWQHVNIPVQSFEEAGVDMTHLDKLHVVFEGGEMSGTIYLDDIQLGEAVH